jgi:hypothetical protein
MSHFTFNMEWRADRDRGDPGWVLGFGESFLLA